MIKKPKDFVIHTIEPKKFIIHTIEFKSKAIDLETVQKNLRAKKKIVEVLKNSLSLLSEDCAEAIVTKKDIKKVEEEISVLWDFFRGKTKQKEESKIYVPMTVDKAINYLAFLTVDNATNNKEDINLILKMINDSSLCTDDRDKYSLSRLQLNLDYLNKKMENCENGKN